uniref:Reticulocalbin 3 n=1 Tax=Chrysemys picta bellii TaxID=8478 RepID=A0A8C3FK62_CHRPI
CGGTRMLWGRGLLVLCVGLALAKPPPEKRDRVHHGQELSDHPHDDRQGFQYDHEAFLGKEQAKTFDQLTPEESREHIDKNGDGYVQVDEYIGDMYTPESGEPEPDWVQSERQQFLDFRDLDRDGRLDRAEIGHWILPQDYDHPEVEAKHLLFESDKDKRLTKQEILDNWNMFVGSQATNYGEDLTRKHDEL